MKGTIVAVLLISLVTALTEMGLFVFLGWIVDRVTGTPKEVFFHQYWPELLGMALVIVLLRPVNAILSRTFGQLGLMPALTFSVRWQSYRYVLRQSLAFFQNDFAGRIAQKVLQTGPSLRDTVNGLIDGIWTLLIYLGGTVWLFTAINPWLIAPVAAWTAAYVVVIVTLVPQVRARSAAVAEANSGLSGRIVDGYSNIQAVKLFAHAEREDAFAYEGFRIHLDAYRAFALTVANLQVWLTIINSLLIFASGGLGAVAVVERGDQRGRHRARHLAGHPPQPDVGHDPAHHHLALRERRHGAERHADDQPALHHRRCAASQAAGRQPRRDPLRGHQLPLRAAERRHRPPVAGG
ncbi:MAG: ABC transporter transmembrane domain-containing protein [Bauldia sp.]